MKMETKGEMTTLQSLINAGSIPSIPQPTPDLHNLQWSADTEVVKKSSTKRTESKSSSSPKRKDPNVPKGLKTYNCKWENDPNLKTWISRHPGDNRKVVCQFCQSLIRAHKNDLLEHSRTRKHQKNLRDGSTLEQFDDKAAKHQQQNSTDPSSCIVANTSTCETRTHPTITLIAPSDINAQLSSNSAREVHSLDIYSSENRHVEIVSCMTSSSENDKHTTNLTPLMSSDYSRSPSSMSNATNSNSSGSNCLTSSVQTFLNLTASSSNNSSNSLDDVLGDAEDLWHESEDFASASSPSASALVSVILEEQLSPGTSVQCDERIISHQSIDATMNGNVPTEVTALNNMILNGINLNIIDGTVTHNQGVGNSTGVNNVQHQTVLLTTKSNASFPFTINDILAAIEGGHFSFSDLILLAKSAVEGIAYCATPQIPTELSSTISADELNILNHHDSQLQPVPNNVTFAYKKDKSPRKRKASGHQLILSKIHDF